MFGRASASRRILDRRLASGEIDIAQYKSILQNIEQNQESKSTLIPKVRLPRRYALGLVAIYYLVAFTMVNSIRHFSMTSDEQFVLFGEATGGLFIALLISTGVGRKSVKGGLITLFVLMIGLLASQANKASSEDKYNANLVDLSNKPGFKSAGMEHAQRVIAAFESAYPAFADNKLAEDIDLRGTPESINKSCLAYKSAAASAEDATNTYSNKLSTLLNNDHEKFAQRLQQIGLQAEYVPRVVKLLDNKIFGDINQSKRRKLYSLLSIKLTTSQNACRFMVEKYGHWSIRQDDAITFETQADTDEFNRLAGHEKSVADGFNTFTKQADVNQPIVPQ